MKRGHMKCLGGCGKTQDMSREIAVGKELGIGCGGWTCRACFEREEKQKKAKLALGGGGGKGQ